MLSALFVGILVARYLGPEQYGLMNYVISYVLIFAIIASFGLDDIEIREMSKAPERFNIIIGTSLGIRLIFATFAYLLIGFSLWIFESDARVIVLVLLYASVLISGIFNVIRNYFTSILENKYIVKSEVVRTFIGVFIKIILLWFKAPLFVFVIATAFDTFLVAGGYLYSYYAKIGFFSKWSFDRKLALFLVKESFPLVLSGSAVVIYQRIDQVMIGDMIDNEAVGYFATADKFLGLILFLPMILVQTITPLLIRIKECDKTLYEMRKRQFVSFVVWISIFIALLVSLSARYLIMWTFGEQYILSVTILQIVSWKTVGMALSASAGQIIIMEHLQKWAAIRNVIGCLVCICGNLLLIPSYGIVGSAWVTIITMLFVGCLANLLIPPYYEVFKIQLRAIFLGWKEITNIKKMMY